MKWFGGLNKETGRECYYGFIERSADQDVFVHGSELRCPKEALDEGTAVTFEISLGDRGYQASDLMLLEDETDWVTIARCLHEWIVNATGPMKRELEHIRNPTSIAAVLDRLATEVQIRVVEAASQGLDARADSLLLHQVQKSTMLDVRAAPLRRKLGLDERFALYIRAARLDDYMTEVVEALEEESQDGVPGRASRPLWERLTLTSRHELFLHAPPLEKLKVWAREHAPLLAAAEGCFAKAAGVTTSWDAAGLYRSLNPDDHALAQLWTSADSEYELAQMLSARAAERASAMFYSALRHDVRDVALEQLHRNGRDWTTHDLLLDGQHPVDVKNARTPYSDDASYVEHTVPRFKETRHVRPSE